MLGFEVKIDLSWIFIALLLTWSLAQGYFPAAYPRLPQAAYWLMGAADALSLFVLIILHVRPSHAEGVSYPGRSVALPEIGDFTHGDPRDFLPLSGPQIDPKQIAGRRVPW
jgi:hypothetical protein